MAQISKPVLLLCAVGVVAAIVLAQQEDRPVQKSKPKAKRAATATKATDYMADDFGARFGKPVSKVRNLFQPLVVSTPAINIEAPTEANSSDDQDKIPADLAGGETGWVFTGFASIDGENMALLQNNSTHQGGFVKKGDPWKSTRIVRLTAQSIVMVDKTGAEKIVLRYDPNKPGKTAGTDAASGVKPVDPGPALKGQIGNVPGGPPGGMQIPPNLSQGTVITGSGPIIIRG